jgi:hypothetical protein
MSTIRFISDEKISHHKTSDWYWIAGIFAATILIVSALMGDILFGVILVLGLVTLIMHGRLPDATYEVEINKKGIRVENKMYLFDQIHTFSIDTNITPHHLIIVSKRMIAPRISIPFSGVDGDDIAEVLRTHGVKEDKTPHHAFHKFLHNIGL